MAEFERDQHSDPGEAGNDPDEAISRRAALAALARYSAAVGGSAVTIVSADGLVSAASAYPEWLSDFCHRYPNADICSDDWWDWWDIWTRNPGGGGGGPGGGGGRGGGGPGGGGRPSRIQF